jgi:gamma-glutamylcyclotransferase (GGCT)/AIG2-like uncharacterized protein YtfP
MRAKAAPPPLGTLPPPGTLPPLGIYGTLLDAEVRRLVLGHCRTRAARLDGWERIFVAGQIYPGIRCRDSATTDVLVLAGLSSLALARCDAFEGAEYERRVLAVTFADGSTGEAMFYVPQSSVRLDDRPWRYDWAWRGRYRRDFLTMTRSPAIQVAMAAAAAASTKRLRRP